MSALALFDWVAQHAGDADLAGGGLATGAGGLWVAVRYLLDRSEKNEASKGKSKRQSQPAGHTASAGVGGAAGRDLRIGGDLTIQQNRIPKSAIGLAALGLLLLGYAAFNSGNRIAVQNGSYVGGNVSGSQINVSPSSRGGAGQ